MSLYVSATVDFADAFRGINAMGQRAVLLPAMKALKAPMRLDQREHAKAKIGPEGGWAPRTQATLAQHRKKKLPSRILGRLPTAVSYLATGLSVVGESRVAWSSVHQDGGTAGHGAKIPARPFLWISEKLLGIAVNALEGAVLAAFGAGS